MPCMQAQYAVYAGLHIHLHKDMRQSEYAGSAGSAASALNSREVTACAGPCIHVNPREPT